MHSFERVKGGTIFLKDALQKFSIDKHPACFFVNLFGTLLSPIGELVGAYLRVFGLWAIQPCWHSEVCIRRCPSGNTMC